MWGPILGTIGGAIVGGLFDRNTSNHQQQVANTFNQEQIDQQWRRNKQASKVDWRRQNNAVDKAWRRQMGEQLRQEQRADAKAKKAPLGINYQHLIKAARKSGFNPLTLLGAGGPGAAMAGQASGGYAASSSPAMAGAASMQPDLASGGFIAEAVSRAIETGFNAYTDDQEAQAIARAKEAKAATNRIIQAASPPPSNFGYDLTDVEPFTPARRSGAPALATSAQLAQAGESAPRPRSRPSPQNSARVPVYNPFGNVVQIPADVAERYDLEPFGQLSGGEYTDLVGEIADVELGLGQNNVRDNLLNSGLITTTPNLPPHSSGSPVEEGWGPNGSYTFGQF